MSRCSVCNCRLGDWDFYNRKTECLGCRRIIQCNVDNTDRGTVKWYAFEDITEHNTSYPLPDLEYYDNQYEEVDYGEREETP